jgi:hypothetical protein
MTTLSMVSWRKGLRAVSLIEAVRDYSTGSLLRAKADVENLLAGQRVVLQFETDSKKNEFRTTAEALGVICE